MKIEEALHKSYCADNSVHECEGVIVITARGTTLACKRCGNEKIPHSAGDDNGRRTLEKRTSFYRVVLAQIQKAFE